MRRPTEHVENDQSEICNLICFKTKRISVPDLVSCSETRQKLDRNWTYTHIVILKCIGLWAPRSQIGYVLVTEFHFKKSSNEKASKRVNQTNIIFCNIKYDRTVHITQNDFRGLGPVSGRCRNVVAHGKP